jgi:hypothetical protein
MKNRNKLKNAANGREWKIIRYEVGPYDIECCMCWRCPTKKNKRKCRKHEACRPNKGIIRNWKEYRKTQWKE